MFPCTCSEYMQVTFETTNLDHCVPMGVILLPKGTFVICHSCGVAALLVKEVFEAVFTVVLAPS